MKLIMCVALFLSLCGSVISANTPVPADRTERVLITTARLSEMMKDPAVAVLMVAQSQRDYDKAHIPGSRFLWPGWLSASNPDLSTQILPIDQIEPVLQTAGVSNASTIVLVSSGGNNAATARVYAVLDYLGMGERTFVLDGGIDVWQSEGRPVTKDRPVVPRGSFRAKIRTDAVADIDFVNGHAGKPGFAIVDARGASAYNARPAVGTRGGHIPGARNISSTVVIDSTSRYVAGDSLRSLFTKAGVRPGDEVISYCQVGYSASVIYLVAKELGYKVRLYDGSFEDWNSRDDMPVEIPPAPVSK